MIKDLYRRKIRGKNLFRKCLESLLICQSNTDSAEQQQVILSNPCKKVDSSSFARLYEKLRNAEDFADRAVQEAIICYCQFGKALIQRRGEIASEKQVDLESNAAKKLWKLFDAIDNMPVDYSIKIESSDCAWPKDGLLSDEKKSELSHPDLSSGSDKKNSELSHTNTSHIEQAPNASSKSGRI
ncbi:unnamed protein product [Rhizophagus irregularis]|uniref:Uncharacterized protein n=1 Tax=Rhizophagus irregularis TaxID=588596 RepID=A0A915ZND6_9GLOM|nr:unnamed protein product [Rhizophagus irregularis]